jgi:hypothetical protein
MKRNFAGGIPLIVLIAIGAVRLSAQKAVSGGPDAMATDEQMNAYLLPAIAAEGGPAYVVPGEVTGDSTVSLTAAAEGGKREELFGSRNSLLWAHLHRPNLSFSPGFGSRQQVPKSSARWQDRL